MPYKDKRKDAFWRQRRISTERGIAFHFTFEGWVAWWEKHLGSGWLSLRGSKAHQYVMARKKDRGAYHPDNIECITASQNATDNNHNNPHGNGGASRGFKHTAEYKLRLSRMRKGKQNPFYGKKHSAETREKMRKSSPHRREKPSAAALEKMSRAQTLRWARVRGEIV